MLSKIEKCDDFSIVDNTSWVVCAIAGTRQ